MRTAGLALLPRALRRSAVAALCFTAAPSGLLLGIAVSLSRCGRLLALVVLAHLRLVLSLLRAAAVARNVGGDVVVDLLHLVGNRVLFTAEQEGVQIFDILLERVRNDAGALEAHVNLAAIHREADGLHNAVLLDIGREAHAVVPGETRRNHREQVAREVRECRRIRLLCLLHAELQDAALPLGSRVVVVHVAETRIGDCLNAVQMVHARVRQLHRADLGALDSLRDIGVDVLKLRLGQVDIHAAEDVDAGRNRLPVEGHIVGDVEVEVLVQRLDRKFRAADRIGLVDLIVIAVRETQIGVAEHARNADFAVLAIDAHNHDDVGIVAASHRGVARVDAEGRDVPVSLHLRNVVGRELRVLDILHLKDRALYLGILLQKIGIGENGEQNEDLEHCHNDKSAPLDCLRALRCFLCNCRFRFLPASASLRLLQLIFHTISCFPQ